MSIHSTKLYHRLERASQIDNTERALTIIRNAFAHVEIVRISVEFNPMVEQNVAKVSVREGQLSQALGEDGIHARNAAIESGLAVQVVLADETRDLQSR